MLVAFCATQSGGPLASKPKLTSDDDGKLRASWEEFKHLATDEDGLIPAYLLPQLPSSDGKVNPLALGTNYPAEFAINLRRAAELNASGTATAEFGVTKFSAIPSEQFALQFANGHLPTQAPDQKTMVDGLATLGRLGGGDAADLPASFDWGKKGALNPVQNQGQCGSCWAYSATASMETANFLSSGKLVKLSEQQLMDCTGRGCGGGSFTVATDYFVNSKQICGDGPLCPQYAQTCYGSCASGHVINTPPSCASVSLNLNVPDHQPGAQSHQVGYVNLWGAKNNEVATKQAIIQYGALAITIFAGNPLQGYRGGVFDPTTSGNCGGSGHAVNLVGWNAASGSDPENWIIRNSWGNTWGENGYFRVNMQLALTCGDGSSTYFSSMDAPFVGNGSTTTTTPCPNVTGEECGGQKPSCCPHGEVCKQTMPGEASKCVAAPPTTTSTTTTTSSKSGSCSALWGQCGGDTWTGPTCCTAGNVCTSQSEYYSQCIPSSAGAVN